MKLVDYDEPFDRFAEWYAEAEANELRVPDAAQLATVDRRGRPRVRTVLVKELGPRGAVFYTNLGSRKAADLANDPLCSLVFHWKSLARQVILAGRVVPLEDAFSDAYWATRPRGSQIGAWASAQSKVIRSRDDLLESVAAVEERFDGAEVPRPPFWGGYRVVVDRFEFWQGRDDRLHERDEYTHHMGRWHKTLLCP